MLVIQWILLPSALLLLAFELHRLIKHAKLSHLFKALVWAGFATCVWKPNLIQSLAGIANIGRGADFLLYMLVVFSLLTTFHFLRRLEEQSRQITVLVREIAIRDARDSDVR